MERIIFIAFGTFIAFLIAPWVVLVGSLLVKGLIDLTVWAFS